MVYLLFYFLWFTFSGDAEWVSRSGKISFYSDAPLEKIEAHNRRVRVSWNPETGDANFLVLMTAFQFKKALMQEHFNENYVESHQYPRASFTGKLNHVAIDLHTNQTTRVTARGQLTLHGVTQPVTIPGTISIQNGQIEMNAVFDLTLSDYKIKIPSIVARNISKQVRVTVSVTDFNQHTP